MDAHKSEKDWAVLQVDLANAFNSIDRQAVLHQVGLRAPHLSHWAGFCYSRHSHLFLSSGHPLTSVQGVQQGDPLGPLFFSLCWQQIVEKLPADLQINLWYLDDGHLVGQADCLRRAFTAVTRAGRAWASKWTRTNVDCGARDSGLHRGPSHGASRILIH